MSFIDGIDPDRTPNYTLPWSYDDRRWGGWGREVTRGGIPTISVCRALALRVLANGSAGDGTGGGGVARELTAADVIEEIARDRGLVGTAETQRTISGEDRLAIRVRWALTSLRQMRYLEAAGRGRFRVTPLGRSMNEWGPARIDELGAGAR